MWLAESIASARLEALLNEIDGGAIRIYSGAPPDNGGALTSQVLLAEFALTSPAGTITGLTLALSVENPTVTVLASGVASWGRIVDSSGAAVLDGAAGIDSGIFRLNTTGLYENGLLVLPSAVITDTV